jgi:hypothetical protein
MDKKGREGVVEFLAERGLTPETLASIEHDLARLCHNGFGQLILVIEGGHLKEVQLFERRRIN